MILIIDGYNLLFNQDWPTQGNTLEEKREHLIKEIALYRDNHHIKRVIIVFDGRQDTSYHAQRTTQQGIEIYYAVCEGKADEKIISLCEELHDVQLVTADRRLARTAKSQRCRILATEQFIKDWYESTVRKNAQIQESCKPPQGTLETQHWLALFGLAEEIEIPENGTSTIRRKKKKTNW